MPPPEGSRSLTIGPASAGPARRRSTCRPGAGRHTALGSAVDRVGHRCGYAFAKAFKRA
ncbi:hypothetical protein [Kitasatospora sp. KL5]|uniref:hypothetical protein n=1 Tax=Kitasatospora sp. KL5 TaxID=3425125 RepID=UPI003D701013